MSNSERRQLIEQYAAGPARLRAAFDTAPEDALKWKPSDSDWSVHEIIVHCADSEAYAAIRIRMLAAEASPIIIGYDQEHWARAFRYHDRPLDPAWQVIESVRASTTELIASFDDAVWSAIGTHSEEGTYSADDWLATYSSHLHDHADQISNNTERWHGRNSG